MLRRWHVKRISCSACSQGSTKERVSIEAKSESEIGQYFQDIDILLLGPHYASLKDELAKQAESFNVVVDVIPQDICGSLDGAGLIAFANRLAE